MRVGMLILAAVGCVQPLAAQLQLRALDGLAAKAKESAEITLDAATLQLANGFLGDAGKNGKAAALLGKVKMIQVRSYEFRGPGAYDAGVVQAIREQLQGQGWAKFVDMKEDDESFVLFSRNQNGRNTGFAMVAAEAKELAVIYIDGEISLSELSGLGGQFGIPKLPPIPGNAKSDKNKKGKE